MQYFEVAAYASAPWQLVCCQGKIRHGHTFCCGPWPWAGHRGIGQSGAFGRYPFGREGLRTEGLGEHINTGVVGVEQCLIWLGGNSGKLVGGIFKVVLITNDPRIPTTSIIHFSWRGPTLLCPLYC